MTKNGRASAEVGLGQVEMPLLQDVPRADAEHERRSRRPRRDPDMEEAWDERWGERRPARSRHDRSRRRRVADDLVALRRLHPRVRHDDPQGAEVRPEHDHERSRTATDAGRGGCRRTASGRGSRPRGRRQRRPRPPAGCRKRCRRSASSRPSSSRTRTPGRCRSPPPRRRSGRRPSPRRTTAGATSGPWCACTMPDDDEQHHPRPIESGGKMKWKLP